MTIRFLLGPSTFNLSLVGAGEDAAVTGDLDVTDTTGVLTIAGVGIGHTIVDAGSLGDHIFHVVSGAALELRNLTVTGGDGGGVVNNGEATLTDIEVSGVTGSGVFNAYGTLTLDSSTVWNNVSGSGAGVTNFGGDLTIVNSWISDNTATGSFGGGGIQRLQGHTADSGTTTIIGSTIAENIGGGLHSSSGHAWTITDTTIADNPIHGGISGSGSFSITDGTFVIAGASLQVGGISGSGDWMISNSVIDGNSNWGGAGSGGGISANGIMTISGSTISNNSSTASGGGIANYGDLTLIDSAISNNSATGTNSYGGGIFNFGDMLTIINSTISGNSANGYSGTIRSRATPTRSSTVTVADSLITNNVSPRSVIHFDGGVDSDQRYNRC